MMKEDRELLRMQVEIHDAINRDMGAKVCNKLREENGLPPINF